MFYPMSRLLVLVIVLILIDIIVGHGRPMTKYGRPDMRFNQNKNDGRLRENRLYGRNLDLSYDMRHNQNKNLGGLINPLIDGIHSYNQCTFQTNKCTPTECYCSSAGYMKETVIDMNGQICWSCRPYQPA